MSEGKRVFEGIWIPKVLWLNDSLKPAEKCLLAEIKSFSENGNECFASNAYLAKFMHMTEGSLKNMVVKLRKEGYIVDVRFDGRRRFIRADITPKLRQGSSKSDGRGHQGVHIDKSIEQSIDKKEGEKEPTSTPKPLSLGTKPPTPVPLAPSPASDSHPCESTQPDAQPKPQPPPPCPKPSGKPPTPRTGQPRKPSKARETWLTPFDKAWFERTGGHLAFASVSRGFKLFIFDHPEKALAWWQNFCKKAPKDDYHTPHSFLRNPLQWVPAAKASTSKGISATERF